jgi:hypothetical protein
MHILTSSMFRPVMVTLREVQNTKQKYIKTDTIGGLNEIHVIYTQCVNHIIKHEYFVSLKQILKLF